MKKGDKTGLGSPKTGNTCSISKLSTPLEEKYLFNFPKDILLWGKLQAEIMHLTMKYFINATERKG